ncbi:hypothetical protein K488DRAFT_74286 [Vararia minispora EC-137]|uniref:Uncharacterized protein n=1 Tax=Vararia minispora EC-137 TaxID=1314806 RepID=A0ACB8Q860_9AGAM|nr:hypothetical protein K488DRAFT_74286 [Vararia minispora EC-137]
MSRLLASHHPLLWISLNPAPETGAGDGLESRFLTPSESPSLNTTIILMNIGLLKTLRSDKDTSSMEGNASNPALSLLLLRKPNIVYVGTEFVYLNYLTHSVDRSFIFDTKHIDLRRILDIITFDAFSECNIVNSARADYHLYNTIQIGYKSMPAIGLHNAAQDVVILGYISISDDASNKSFIISVRKAGASSSVLECNKKGVHFLFEHHIQSASEKIPVWDCCKLFLHRNNELLTDVFDAKERFSLVP